MSKWLDDLKDSDKVALMILFVGVAITGAATLGCIAVFFHAGKLPEQEVARAVSTIKDFFGVGTSLIGAALLALKLQPKNSPPPPEAPQQKAPVKWP
jgi:hypothetical protein